MPSSLVLVSCALFLNRIHSLIILLVSYTCTALQHCIILVSFVYRYEILCTKTGEFWSCRKSPGNFLVAFGGVLLNRFWWAIQCICTHKRSASNKTSYGTGTYLAELGPSNRRFPFGKAQHRRVLDVARWMKGRTWRHSKKIEQLEHMYIYGLIDILLVLVCF